MRRCIVLVVIASILLMSCASASPEERPYRVCVWNSARTYFDTGTVLGTTVDDDGEKVYLVQLDRWPADGKHINRVRIVDRACAAVSMQQRSPFAPPGERQK